MKSKTRAPRSRGARAIVAMLPRGGSVWLTVDPTLAPARELDRLADSMGRADIRHVRTFDSNAAAARKLARTIKQGAVRAGRSRSREYRKLRSQILSGDAKVGRRIDDFSTRVAREAQAERKTLSRLLRSRGRRDLLNHLVLVSATVLMAAYGQRNDPFAENNLVIAISLIVWLVGDDISDLLAGKRSIHAGPIRGSDIWSYTAPFANLLTGWWLLNEQQHHRFITGTTEGEVVRRGSEGVFDADVSLVKSAIALPSYGTDGNARNAVFERRAIEQKDAYSAIVDLSSRIAPEHLPDFRNFSDVSAVATIRSMEVETQDHPKVELLEAKITEGSWLLITVKVSATHMGTVRDHKEWPPILKRLAVSWVVDTQEPSA